ncbi:MAG TPA: thioredoxin family protein [candidate division Zixibacteria bacterium]
MQTHTSSRWAYGITGVLVMAMFFFNLNFWNMENGCTQAQTQNQKPATPIQVLQSQAASSKATQSLMQALSAGKFACLFFYETGNADCETMETNLDAFARKNKKGFQVVKVDRQDPNNSDVVNTLGTQNAPIPLTLLIDPSSAIVAAFTKVVTPDELAQAIPSPRKTETLKYMQQGKGVILCFNSKKMSSCRDVQTCCSQAETQLGGKAEYISIDLSDPKEANFIKELKVDPNTAVPVTFVINSQGQVTGKYDGEVQVTNLVEAATKVVKSGCCAPGSGKTCPPPQPKKK